MEATKTLVQMISVHRLPILMDGHLTKQPKEDTDNRKDYSDIGEQQYSNECIGECWGMTNST